MNITPNEKQEQLIGAALSGKYDFILYGGGIRGSKTFGMLLTFLLAKNKYKGMRAVYVRKDMPLIQRNTYPTFEKIKTLSISQDRRYDNTNPRVEYKNGAELIFFGENYSKDKELNRWKGLEANWFLIDEINELQEKSFFKAFERFGSYSIPNNTNPHPVIIATCNPSHGWVKRLVYDKWKDGTLPERWLYIPATVYDNVDFLRENPNYINNLRNNLRPYEFEVFVNGNWDLQLKSGGEFLKAFELNDHVKKHDYADHETVHIVVDNNVHPYIAVSIFQMDGLHLKQIAEMPCREPNNTASKAAGEVVNWLKDNNYNNTVFIYADQTTTNNNTIDINKKSFLDLFCDVISKSYSIRKRIPSKNPPVALSGDFVNTILEKEYLGAKISIDDKCTESINDYVLTKENSDGGVLKKRVTDSNTGISYEEHGHYTDCLRYIACEVFNAEFRQFQRRFDATAPTYAIGNKLQHNDMIY